MGVLCDGVEYCHDVPYDAAGGDALLAAVVAALGVGKVMVERHCVPVDRYTRIGNGVYAVEVMCLKPAFHEPGKFYVCIVRNKDSITICIKKTCRG